MPNWAEGTLKLRGRRENIKSALKEMFIGSDVSISELKFLYLSKDYNLRKK